MSAPARLLSVRLQGFKSFADKTTVEFGPGISAIVGPNGSGKSNLADALRWALGEQGRALRARKSEDVVWAGSESRAAIGMADVTIVLDNADGLLSLEYGVIELGRRLYRSGENEYLLNRSRVRLRDLVDLLDTANLADNAFLFIGQGMVDQALALRPEERRPLFEEVAGVRRHERRRRRAEEQLVEAEANLARVHDVLGELRPQARRLAAQAEQQAARRSTADDLVEALLAAAHHRWHGAAGRERAASEALVAARAAVDVAMAALGEADERVRAGTAELAGQAEAEAAQLTALEAAVGRVTELRLEDAGLAGAVAADERERDRLHAELETSLAELESARRAAAEPLAGPDPELDAALAAADRSLAEALAEAAALRASEQAHEAYQESSRRAAAARAAEVETARRVLEEATRRRVEEVRLSESAVSTRSAAEARHRELHEALERSGVLERSAIDQRRDARAALERAEAAMDVAGRRVAEVAERSRLAVVASGSPGPDGIETIADGAGAPVDARRLGDGLEVDPVWRAAVDAALADAVGAPILGRAEIARLAGTPGTAIVDEADDPIRDREADTAFRDRVVAAGGGMLRDVIRRDAARVAGRLLARVGWVSDLDVALELQAHLPIGWSLVTRDGSSSVRPLVVTMEPERGRLERRAERDRARAALPGLEAELGAAREIQAAATADVEAARAAEREAADAETRAIAARRRLSEDERVAGRALESAVREALWHEAQLERLANAEDRARTELERIEPEIGPAPAHEADEEAVAAVAGWERRAAERREARDRLAAERDRASLARRAAETRQATAAAGVAIAERRIEAVTAEIGQRGETMAAAAARRERLAADLAAATAIEADARATLERLRAGSAGGRSRLADAESASQAARDALRAAEDAARAAEMTEVEARLALEAVREAVLVDLAALGELGLDRLRRDLDLTFEAPGGDEADGEGGDGAGDARLYEQAFAAISPAWTADAPAGEPPSPARLSTLRRRYHELGATNPLADREYAEVAERLAGLEAQEGDLRGAIESTRRLIGELNALIADQFRTTFQALEAAFDRRFRQLFGGGFARLELTDPADLSATGIEIVARPPGKKPQALAMLSGGERALTAVALLFAMLEVRPVPFCVLDEVDAALDEANIGRFTEALSELATRTQCIVITHNRGTIEVADALYGVTVGDDSVSRVISLRLDEATAIAQERVADERAADEQRSAAPVAS